MQMESEPNLGADHGSLGFSRTWRCSLVTPVYPCSAQEDKERAVSSAQCAPCTAETGRSQLIISVLP